MSKIKFWLPIVGIIVGFLVLNYFVVPWVIDRKNDLIYGKVRTHHISFDLNPTDETTQLSYFTAMNIEGRVKIFGVLPEPAQTLELTGLNIHGKYASREPVILSATLYNDDPYPDLTVNVNGDIIVYLAENGTFTRME